MTAINEKITPVEFAQKHLGQYKTQGDEIIPVYCPYCKGGAHGDKHTFAMNMHTGTYNCRRGKCAESGSFWKLCKDFGELTERDKFFETRPRRKKEYIPPQTQVKPPSSPVEEYLKKRGFSKATWERRGVGDDGKGNIAMPYYENGKLVMMKFRPAKKADKGRKGWREEGGKPVFWGMDQCDPRVPLVIVEGEMDALALDEAGIPNVVSVPSGAEDLTCVDLCWDWLQQFKRVYLWVDNDEPGKKLQRNLITKLGSWRCSIVVSERKDANEVLLLDGKEEICKAIRNAVEVPINGLMRLADVRAFDYSQVPRVSSGIRGMDRVIGGFMMGETSIWTGINSSGKSTLLGQLMLEAVNQGHGVCVYSGELPGPIFRYWIDLQAAGPAYIEGQYDQYRETEVMRPTQKPLKYIRDWYRDKFFLIDAFGGITSENLFEVFEYAARRYNAKVFMIDNLMMMAMGGSDKDFYRAQSEFVGKVVNFAHEFEVHVHLVAHPRKTNDKRLTKMDIAGSGDITNRADNVFGVHRVRPEEKGEFACDTIVDVFKNRFSGKQDVAIQLNFDNKSKRFYMPSSSNDMFKKFGWVKAYEEAERPGLGEEVPMTEEVAQLFGG